ncbi:MAG: T9SS C-terminal target domain-containing protein [Candidatus Zixiibacteriota bacterium]|nr:MAG: T9SS C-terminal target domain-containing protein [candidate division Zixibacteria bacterium]
MNRFTRFLLAAGLLAVLAPGARAQISIAWASLYSGPADKDRMAYAIVVDSAGNVYVTGSDHVSGAVTDIATVKYNAAGQQQWAAIYNGSGNGEDMGKHLCLDGDGNPVMAGYCTGSGSGKDFVVVKYDPAGNILWQATYNGPGNGNDWITGLAVTGDNEIYVTGVSEIASGGAATRNFTTIKYNAQGQQAWVAAYNGPGNGQDEANALALAPAGGVYVNGAGAGIGTGLDFVTLHYSSEGVLQWEARYDGPTHGDDKNTRLAVDGAGNVITAGWSTSTSSFDYATVKYSPTGAELWVRRYNSTASAYDKLYDVGVTADNGIIVTGEGASGWVHTIKYNPEGDTLWINNGYHSSGFGIFLEIVSSGEFYLALEHTWDVYLAKFSSDGVFLGDVGWNGPGDDWDPPKAITSDADGNIYITGYTDTNPEPNPVACINDYMTLKYIQPSLSLTLAPVGGPIPIPPAGGSYTYLITLGNTGSSPVTAEAWCDLTKPNGQMYGPTVGPVTLTLPVGASLSRNRSQTIPAVAAPGTYWQNGYVGDYPSTIWEEDSFSFVKLAGSDGGAEVEGWACTGDLFPGESQTPFIPSGLTLSASPNPFNPTTAVSYELPAASRLNLKVYDTAGREVATLVEGWREAGSHEVTFDAAGLPSGVYLLRMQAGEYSEVMKMMLVK